MDWYYYDGKKQKGPITEGEFNDLAQSGAITPETLVWRAGMQGWVKFAALPPAQGGAAAPQADMGTCAQCGGSFPQDGLITHGNSQICEQCKPVFLQKLKEGAWTGGNYNYAGFWIRFCAKFVDGLIMMVLIVAVGVAMAFTGSVGEDMSIAAQLILQLGYWVILLGYSTFFHGKFGATPGKMACKLKVIVSDGSKVSYLRALGRGASEFLSSILYIGYIMAGFDAEKRALHDRICSTRVIRK